MKKFVSSMLAVALITSAGALCAQSPEFKVIDPAINFPEGPYYHDGRIYYVGMSDKGVRVFDGAEVKSFYDDEACGATAVVGDATRLLVACYSGRYIAVVDHEGKLIAKIQEDAEGQPLVGPNDFTSDNKGGWFFTVTGTDEDNYTRVEGKVYHIDEDLKVRQMDNKIHYPNGIALSSDGKTLIVGEAEANRLLAYDVQDDATLKRRRVFSRINKVDPQGGIDAYPDGVKFAPDGNIWVGLYTSPRIVVISGEDGSFIKGIDFEGDAATNMAFDAKGEKVVITIVNDTTNAPWVGEVREYSYEAFK